MTDTDGTEYRQHYRATGSDMTVREDVETQEGDDGIIEIRMPIASTGEVRNANDDPLTRDELNGMARQLKERDIGVFPAHGMSDMIASSKYSPFERLGDWHDAAIESREDENLLMATARMPDPETLPAATGKFREALAILKEQAMRGISQDASIGWRDDDSFPGGVDLMEASIVGIGADWRTNTADDSAETVARAAVDAGADPAELIDAVREAVSDGESLNQQNGPDSDDSLVKTDGDRAEYEVADETIDITPPDYMVDNAARAKEAEADPDIDGDCGTGVGDSRAGQIVDDAVGPDVVAEIAAYLTSHEEDVTADGSTGEWSAEEWADCGNRQYAKWGGDGSGDALEWAQGKTNEVADARDEELPYPDRQSAETDSMTDADDPGDEQAGADSETEQGAADEAAETTERAPGDVDAERFYTFVARHLDGMDESSLADAVDASDAEYIGGVDVEELADVVSAVVGAEYDDVVAMFEDMMDAANENEGDKDGDEDEDEDDEDMNTADSEDADAEQSADTDANADADGDTDDDADNLLRDIEDQLEQVDDAREALRNGDVDIEYAAGDGEVETDSEQDSDDDLAGLDLRESNLPN